MRAYSWTVKNYYERECDKLWIIYLLPGKKVFQYLLHYLVTTVYWLSCVQLGAASWIITVLNHSIPLKWSRTGLHTNGSFHRVHNSICKS